MRTGNTTGKLVLGFASLIFLSAFCMKALADEQKDRQEQRLTIMKDRLKLSDGQVNEIRAIMESARLRAERDREKFRESGDREAARKIAEARREETEKKILAVLNEKQRKEYDKMRDEIRKRRDDRDGKPGGRRGGMRYDGGRGMGR